MRFHRIQHIQKNGLKEIAILIDPDELGEKTKQIVTLALKHHIHWFLVGGSLISQGNTQKCVDTLKELGVPNVILFPGNEIQLANNADALLFMSLISGRNPEFLISKQVSAAPWVKQSKIETIPTGYMLVESGKITSALYMSNSLPLPCDKPDIAAATAMAGELLGLQLLYLDAGSGAQNPIPGSIILAVKQHTNCAIFVGGGLTSPENVLNAWENGADFVVMGNSIFDKPNIIEEFAHLKHFYNQKITT
jgi:putative glycerol-1-phosphate prenyltransferase